MTSGYPDPLPRHDEAADDFLPEEGLHLDEKLRRPSILLLHSDSTDGPLIEVLPLAEAATEFPSERAGGDTAAVTQSAPVTPAIAPSLRASRESSRAAAVQVTPSRKLPRPALIWAATVAGLSIGVGAALYLPLDDATSLTPEQRVALANASAQPTVTPSTGQTPPPSVMEPSPLPSSSDAPAPVLPSDTPAVATAPSTPVARRETVAVTPAPVTRPSSSAPPAVAQATVPVAAAAPAVSAPAVIDRTPPVVADNRNDAVAAPPAGVSARAVVGDTRNDVVAAPPAVVPPGVEASAPPARAESAVPRSESAARTETTAARSSAAPATNAGVAQVRELLARYRSAFETRDASSAKRIWPSVDERALARAFGALESQTVTFDACDVAVVDARAVASCRGSASYVTRVGNRSIETPGREWNFTLQKSADRWVIDSVQTR